MAAKSGQLDLRDIWLFSACSTKELREIRRSVEEVNVPAGAVLVEEGTIGREFFFIVEGTSSVRRNGRRVTTLGPGNYFGELALLDRKPRSASVVAETDMTLLVLEQRSFNGILDSIPGIANKLLIAMSQRLREADTRVNT